MITTIICATLVLIVYLIYTKYQYWKKRGINGPKPKPLIGNLGQSFLLKAQPGEVYTEIYRDYKDDPVVGAFRAMTPILLVRDPDLIKEITTKSFSHFHDNDIDIQKEVDPLFGRNPFALKGQEWKTVRAQLTPAFTSGKMKFLYPFLEGNSLKMVKFLETHPEVAQGFEAKELCTRFTLNNVGNSIFGINAKCFDEENSEFRQLATDFFSPGSWTAFVVFAAVIFPSITSIFPLRFVSKKVTDKLTNIVSEALKYRQTNGIIRKDFLHILNELKQSIQNFTDIDVTAHAAGFFTDGYETSSVVMSFCLFELARNQEAQSKLRVEIVKAFENNNNTLPYEVLQSLPYLDCVINETLRVDPPVFVLQKITTESFTFDLKETNKKLTIEKGTPIILPLHGLQTDERYFKDASKFQPERFLSERKDEIRKGTYMPLGDGPRACLGQRFGLLQIKVGLAYVIKEFELSVNVKTKLPLKLDPIHILNVPVGGLWINFKKI